MYTIEIAREMTRELGDRSLEAEFLATLGTLQLKNSKFNEAELTLERVLNMSAIYDSPELKAYVCAYLTLVLRWKKNRAKSLYFCEMAVALIPQCVIARNSRLVSIIYWFEATFHSEDNCAQALQSLDKS
jgi:hypothetical protein